MKIHFDNVNMSSATGPNTFASRLAKQLFCMGHEVTFSADNADASLVFIEPTGAKLAYKVVQRVDGFWFKATEYKTKNTNIKRLYDRADAVVFQSEFDKTFITKFWGDPKKFDVIGNGIHTQPITKFNLPGLEQLRAQYKTMFVCSANWHPQKRLNANIDMFKHLRAQSKDTCCLLVLGNNVPRMQADKDIFYAGSLPEEQYMEVYSACDWMIHLAWLDHCPNTVIECISQNTPVICSEDGGTKEIVKDFGVVLKETSPFVYELCDYDNPPHIDVTQLTTLPQKCDLGKSIDTSIVNVAQNYIKLFQEL